MRALGVLAAVVLAGCAPPAPPPVDSPLLTADDLAVLRTVAVEVVRARLRSGFGTPAILAEGPILVFSPTMSAIRDPARSA